MWSVVLAVLSAVALVTLGDLRAAPMAAVGVMMAWGLGVWSVPRPRTRSLAILVGLAATVRGIVLLSPASLSDDLYRYLWEGSVVLQGGNPYLHPPADPIWNVYADDVILQQVNHPEVSAVYPPLALLLFATLSALHHGPLVVKAFMALCDVGTVWALGKTLQLRGRSLDGAWLYALLPLGVIESAGSGHLEALGVLSIALAVLAWEQGRSGIGWAGLGALLKFLPGPLLPALSRRSPWLFGAVGAVGVLSILPFIDAGPALIRGLSTYATHWRFNAGGFVLFDLVFGDLARPLAVLTGAVVTAWACLRMRQPARVALWVGGAFVLLSPTVHPWYVLWAWVPALLCGVRSWTWLAVMAPLSYVVLTTLDPVTGAWEEAPWPAAVQFIPLVALLLWEARTHLLQPGPWAPERA